MRPSESKLRLSESKLRLSESKLSAGKSKINQVESKAVTSVRLTCAKEIHGEQVESK